MEKETKKNNIITKKNILVFLIILCISAWLFFLFADKVHYQREGRITKVKNETYYYANDPQQKYIEKTYYYIDKENEEIVQSSDDMNMDAEKWVKKYNYKYFYSYRTWTCHLIYLAAAIILMIIAKNIKTS